MTHGFYNFLNWFDERAWYPLGRIVGGTVSILHDVLLNTEKIESQGLYYHVFVNDVGPMS